MLLNSSPVQENYRTAYCGTILLKSAIVRVRELMLRSNANRLSRTLASSTITITAAKKASIGAASSATICNVSKYARDFNAPAIYFSAVWMARCRSVSAAVSNNDSSIVSHSVLPARLAARVKASTARSIAAIPSGEAIAFARSQAS